MSQTEVKIPSTFNQAIIPQFQQTKVAQNDQMNLQSIQQSFTNIDNQMSNMNFSTSTANSASQQAQMGLQQPNFASAPATSINMNTFAQQGAQQAAEKLPAVNQLAASMMAPPNVAAAFQASTAATQFAAGFAAATALSHQQFRSILGQALASFPNGQPPQQFPPSKL
jgi:hypothetical protein